MLEIICGAQGKGKSRVLIEKINQSIESASGNLIFIDKSQKHIYELNNRIRLINISDYPVLSSNEFFGFICGIIAQDNDIEEIYLDSFLTISFIQTEEEIVHAMERLDVISEKYNVKIILSIAKEEQLLPACAKAKVTISL